MTVHTLDIALTDQVLVSKDKGGLQRHIAVEAFGSSPAGTLWNRHATISNYIN